MKAGASYSILQGYQDIDSIKTLSLGSLSITNDFKADTVDKRIYFSTF